MSDWESVKSKGRNSSKSTPTKQASLVSVSSGSPIVGRSSAFGALADITNDNKRPKKPDPVVEEVKPRPPPSVTVTPKQTEPAAPVLTRQQLATLESQKKRKEALSNESKVSLDNLSQFDPKKLVSFLSTLHKNSSKPISDLAEHLHFLFAELYAGCVPFGRLKSLPTETPLSKFPPEASKMIMEFIKSYLDTRQDRETVLADILTSQVKAMVESEKRAVANTATTPGGPTGPLLTYSSVSNQILIELISRNWPTLFFSGLCSPVPRPAPLPAKPATPPGSRASESKVMVAMTPAESVFSHYKSLLGAQPAVGNALIWVCHRQVVAAPGQKQAVLDYSGLGIAMKYLLPALQVDAVRAAPVAVSNVVQVAALDYLSSLLDVAESLAKGGKAGAALPVTIPATGMGVLLRGIALSNSRNTDILIDSYTRISKLLFESPYLRHGSVVALGEPIHEALSYLFSLSAELEGVTRASAVAANACIYGRPNLSNMVHGSFHTLLGGFVANLILYEQSLGERVSKMSAAMQIVNSGSTLSAWLDLLELAINDTVGVTSGLSDNKPDEVMKISKGVFEGLLAGRPGKAFTDPWRSATFRSKVDAISKVLSASDRRFAAKNAAIIKSGKSALDFPPVLRKLQQLALKTKAKLSQSQKLSYGSLFSWLIFGAILYFVCHVLFVVPCLEDTFCFKETSTGQFISTQFQLALTRGHALLEPHLNTCQEYIDRLSPTLESAQQRVKAHYTQLETSPQFQQALQLYREQMEPRVLDGRAKAILWWNQSTIWAAQVAVPETAKFLGDSYLKIEPVIVNGWKEASKRAVKSGRWLKEEVQPEVHKRLALAYDHAYTVSEKLICNDWQVKAVCEAVQKK